MTRIARQSTRSWKRMAFLGTLGLITGIVLAAARTGRLAVSSSGDVGWSSGMEREGGYVASADIAAGEEITMVYIGSAACGWSNHADLPDAIEDIKTALLASSEGQGIRFAAVGIARDAFVIDGLRHLGSFGRFDEVMAGRSWANTGIQKYVYGAVPGPAATPQVLVLRRQFSYESGHVSIVDEQAIARVIGLDRILEWADAGASLAASGVYQSGPRRPSASHEGMVTPPA